MKDITEVLTVLKKNNPKVSGDKIRMYADAFIDYEIAASNIKENGSICAHPKTGGPIENPYLKVRGQMHIILSKSRLNTLGLWE